ncbi:MAG: o-succinylbenzoate synthase [Burkholderiales bacterium]|nr:o-succinylbenzoate synthase [Burkholderiales bacterium]
MARNFNLYRYRMPFSRKGETNTRHTHEVREGLIVSLEDGDTRGQGEIAPLPRLSVETLIEAEQQALDLLSQWQARRAIEPTLERAAPSVAFGLSAALSELTGALPETCQKRSATLMDCADIAAFIENLQRSDAREKAPVVKIKVGRDAPDTEARAVLTLMTALPWVKVRLDANRAWTLNEALDFARHLNARTDSSIAFIEEPCQTPALSLRFAQETGIKIAWDEHVREADFHPNDAKTSLVAAWVIKPSLTGSIARCRALTDQARQHRIDAVISSSYESSLGLTQLMRLAAWLSPETLPGLDTGHVFQTCIARGMPDDPRAIIPLSSLEKIA